LIKSAYRTVGLSLGGSTVSIREATAEDASVIARFVRRMVEAMASVGGHPATNSREEWARLENEICDKVGKQDHVYLLAEVVDSEPTPIGLAGARVVSLAPVFEPRRVLHIHSLYVSESHRKRGVGQALLETVIDWGRDLGCVEAELSVLVRNPARSLYQKLGFGVFEMEMTRKL
jgi:GNAT superfamily N-acetyltransferase